MSLKRELESPRSPIRRFLDEQLPYTAGVLDPWQKALRGVKPQLPGEDPAGEPTPHAILGHAITARIGWDFAPADRPGTRAGGLALVAEGASATMVDELVTRLSGPLPQHPYDAARLSWFAGLLDRAHRSGRWDEPAYQPILTAETVDELLLQVPAHWAADIVAVERKAERALSPLANEEGAAALVGASLAGSVQVDGAEADLLLAGTVVDLKVTATTKTRLRDLHQVLALALLDFDDEHSVTHIALAPVRFGLLVRWDLSELVVHMAGRAVELAQLRSDLRDRLASSAAAATPATPAD